MNIMLKVVVWVVLLLAGGPWAVPARANEVVVASEVKSFLPWWVDMEVFRVECTQTSDIMCIALINWDSNETLVATAVMSSPVSLVGSAWAERVQPNDFRTHCFEVPGNSKLLMTGYVTATLDSDGPISYNVVAQCWSGSPSTGYWTRSTSVTQTQHYY